MMSSIRLYWLNSVTRCPRAFSLASSRSKTPILPAASTMSSPGTFPATTNSCWHAVSHHINRLQSNNQSNMTALLAQKSSEQCSKQYKAHTSCWLTSSRAEWLLPILIPDITSSIQSTKICYEHHAELLAARMGYQGIALGEHATRSHMRESCSACASRRQDFVERRAPGDSGSTISKLSWSSWQGVGRVAKAPSKM